MNYRIFYAFLLAMLCQPTYLHTTVQPIYDGENMWQIIKRIGIEVDEIGACDSTPITTPTTISSPGFYCLANDIIGTVTIAADNVTFNLNNHTIYGPNGGIFATGQTSINIQNGTITQVAGACITLDNVSESKIIYCDLKNSDTGILLNQSGQIIIDHCNALSNNEGFSFVQSSSCCVQNCRAIDNTNDGFGSDQCYALIVTNCISTGNSIGYNFLNSFNIYAASLIGNSNITGIQSLGNNVIIVQDSSFNYNQQ